MKPTKNRFFCLACQRAKMLFPTKSKAENFIKFNHDDIADSSEMVPVRTYYCSFCCGWHVTSKENARQAKFFDRRDQHILKRISVINHKNTVTNR